MSASKYGSSILLLEAKQQSTARSSNLKLQDQRHKFLMETVTKLTVIMQAVQF